MSWELFGFLGCLLGGFLVFFWGGGVVDLGVFSMVFLVFFGGCWCFWRFLRWFSWEFWCFGCAVRCVYLEVGIGFLGFPNGFLCFLGISDVFFTFLLAFTEVS